MKKNKTLSLFNSTPTCTFAKWLRSNENCKKVNNSGRETGEWETVRALPVVCLCTRLSWRDSILSDIRPFRQAIEEGYHDKDALRVFKTFAVK